MRRCIFFYLSIYIGGYSCGAMEDAKFWQDQGLKKIQEKLQIERIFGKAKNVILFIGDGMGLSHITPGRIFKGQLQGKSGEEGSLYFETFPFTSLSKTYCVDRQVPDSASTATAIYSGVKANYETLGLDARSKYNVCDPDVQEKAKVTTIIDWAITAGKSTGIVTTARVTHATPAAAYSHCPNRDWECDSAIPQSERGKGCKDIARQLVEDEPGRNLNVIMGGGLQNLVSGVENPTNGTCTRSDGRNLVKEWKNFQTGLGRKSAFVSNKEELMNVNEKVTHLLGIFQNSHMSYDKDRNLSNKGEPSLRDMVSKAVDVLSKDPDGFVLIVEGAKIDIASHDNYAKIAIEELVALDAAVETARNKTNERDTLVIVTADHSHSLAMNGNPKRGNPIEGIGDVTPEGFAYQTLSYINGKAYDVHRVESPVNDTKESLKSVNTWINLNKTEGVTERYFRHHAGFWMDLETHGGEDVAVYAVGPYAHLFTGVNEQTHIAYTIAYSAQIGPFSQKWGRGTPGNASTNLFLSLPLRRQSLILS